MTRWRNCQPARKNQQCTVEPVHVLVDNRPTCCVRLAGDVVTLSTVRRLVPVSPVVLAGAGIRTRCLDITRGKRHDGNRGRRIEPVILMTDRRICRCSNHAPPRGVRSPRRTSVASSQSTGYRIDEEFDRRPRIRGPRRAPTDGVFRRQIRAFAIGNPDLYRPQTCCRSCSRISSHAISGSCFDETSEQGRSQEPIGAEQGRAF